MAALISGRSLQLGLTSPHSQPNVPHAGMSISIAVMLCAIAASVHGQLVGSINGWASAGATCPGTPITPATYDAVTGNGGVAAFQIRTTPFYPNWIAYATGGAFGSAWGLNTSHLFLNARAGASHNVPMPTGSNCSGANLVGCSSLNQIHCDAGLAVPIGRTACARVWIDRLPFACAGTGQTVGLTGASTVSLFPTTPASMPAQSFVCNIGPGNYTAEISAWASAQWSLAAVAAASMAVSLNEQTYPLVVGVGTVNIEGGAALPNGVTMTYQSLAAGSLLAGMTVVPTDHVSSVLSPRESQMLGSILIPTEFLCVWDLSTGTTLVGSPVLEFNLSSVPLNGAAIPADLRIYRFDGSAWQEMPGTSYSPGTATITISSPSLGRFVVGAACGSQRYGSLPTAVGQLDLQCSLIAPPSHQAVIALGSGMPGGLGLLGASSAPAQFQWGSVAVLIDPSLLQVLLPIQFDSAGSCEVGVDLALPSLSGADYFIQGVGYIGADVIASNALRVRMLP